MQVESEHHTIALVGGTGTVGQHVAKALADRKDVVVRIITRDTAAAKKKLALPNAQWIELDVATAQSQALVTALTGSDRLFLCVPSMIIKVEPKICEAAKKAGVKHVVKVSSIFASKSFPPGSVHHAHGAAEDAMLAMDIPVTVLRCHHFIQNLINFELIGIKCTGKLYNAVEAKQTMARIDTRDIADCAVAVLTGSIQMHGGRGYELTGSQCLSFPEQMAILSKHIGKEVEHVCLGDAFFYKQMTTHGMAEWLAFFLVQLDQSFRLRCNVPYATGDVEILTGHKPRTYEDYVIENKDFLLQQTNAVQQTNESCSVSNQQ